MIMISSARNDSSNKTFLVQQAMTTLTVSHLVDMLMTNTNRNVAII